MSDSLTLTEFVPGTKAKAQEVNANFAALKDALKDKAAIDGDSTQAFSVANATLGEHSVNKAQLDTLSKDLTSAINKSGTKFCVKSGNITGGKGNLFSYSILKITPLIGGTYKNLVISDYEGTQTTISSVDPISMSGKPNGDYNIFISPKGILYTLDNTIYKQNVRPTMLDGDVWLDTSFEPFNCVKYDGTNDNKFLDVPLGTVTVASSAISAIETFMFNENGNNITVNTTLERGTTIAASIPNFMMPDYSKGVNKSFSTVYKEEKDGFLYAQSDFGIYVYVSTDNSNWTTFMMGRFDGQGYGNGGFIPIPKGVYYKAAYSSCRNSSLVFYPCLGE